MKKREDSNPQTFSDVNGIDFISEQRNSLQALNSWTSETHCTSISLTVLLLSLLTIERLHIPNSVGVTLKKFSLFHCCPSNPHSSLASCSKAYILEFSTLTALPWSQFGTPSYWDIRSPKVSPLPFSIQWLSGRSLASPNPKYLII